MHFWRLLSVLLGLIGLSLWGAKKGLGDGFDVHLLRALRVLRLARGASDGGHRGHHRGAGVDPARKDHRKDLKQLAEKCKVMKPVFHCHQGCHANGEGFSCHKQCPLPSDQIGAMYVKKVVACVEQAIAANETDKEKECTREIRHFGRKCYSLHEAVKCHKKCGLDRGCHHQCPEIDLHDGHPKSPPTAPERKKESSLPNHLLEQCKDAAPTLRCHMDCRKRDGGFRCHEQCPLPSDASLAEKWKKAHECCKTGSGTLPECLKDVREFRGQCLKLKKMFHGHHDHQRHHDFDDRNGRLRGTEETTKKLPHGVSI